MVRIPKESLSTERGLAAALAATRGTGKAIIAWARKFLGIIYQTLTHNWIVADFPRFVLASH